MILCLFLSSDLIFDWLKPMERYENYVYYVDVKILRRGARAAGRCARCRSDQSQSLDIPCLLLSELIIFMVHVSFPCRRSSTRRCNDVFRIRSLLSLSLSPSRVAGSLRVCERNIDSRPSSILTVTVRHEPPKEDANQYPVGGEWEGERERIEAVGSEDSTRFLVKPRERTHS